MGSIIAKVTIFSITPPNFQIKKKEPRIGKKVKEGRRRREIKEKKERVGEAYIHISCPSLQVYQELCNEPWTIQVSPEMPHCGVKFCQQNLEDM